MGANITSVEGVYKDLAAAGPRTVERAKLVLKKTALDIEANAKAIAPVDFGNLKESIGHSDLRTLSATNLSVEIGPTVNYGQYVELGTSRQAPQAYMGPSLDRFSGPFEQAVAQLGLDALNG
ncbi:HK97-gp10 family putative phage morphogenesis protein [Pseudarthrobacter sp. MEB009]|uniref:HK97-gp10 family putative phage morphogenesis protein n=1 Tax=Pseudarthrobacter sp. MEB009 TaxID=3040326 RepID=UPI002553E607|nr:HK97-gp10 family putative phage morphogenesis protein [Pseudarthrobacter sp. MEB009]